MEGGREEGREGWRGGGNKEVKGKREGGSVLKNRTLNVN